MNTLALHINGFITVYDSLKEVSQRFFNYFEVFFSIFPVCLYLNVSTNKKATLFEQGGFFYVKSGASSSGTGEQASYLRFPGFDSPLLHTLFINPKTHSRR
jgi:hypothetical protein